MVKIKKRTKAQTPAPKSDQVKGSAKNPKGSAGGSRGGIEIGERAVKALEKLRDDHNARFTKKARRVDLGMLKAVFRRGAGAFSVSHRPGMDRNQWAVARVRTFLKLVATGQRKKAYTGDLDLLPKGHPQHVEKVEKRNESIPDKYSHIDFSPPKAVREAADRALKVRESKPSSKRGMTPVGIARARDLKNGRQVSPETARRMLAYFTRHESDKAGASWSDKGKGWQAWHGWGGDAGFAFARRIVKQMNAADNKTNTLSYGESVEVGSLYDVPDGLTIGKPFKTLGIGAVNSRLTGDGIGKEVDYELLSELLRVYQDRRLQDPVIIDWQHATSPYQNSGSPAPPESGNALGLIVDLELRDDGLYAVPAYNERGLDVVNNAGGVLWSSPEFLTGDVFDRGGGERIGTAQLLAVTLTPRPAQSHDRIDRITLNERFNDMDDLSVEEMRAQLAAKDEMVKQLEAKIAEMKADSESSINKSAEKDDDDDKNKLAEKDDDDDKKKLAEKDDDDDKSKLGEEYKRMNMSESASPALLSEVQALRESVATLKAERDAMQRDQAVNVLLSEGRISPAESTVAGKAYELKELQPEFWAHFSERASKIPLNEIGHGASGAEVTKQSLDARIKQVATDKAISYSEALGVVRLENPSFYNQAFGG